MPVKTPQFKDGLIFLMVELTDREIFFALVLVNNRFQSHLCPQHFQLITVSSSFSTVWYLYILFLILNCFHCMENLSQQSVDTSDLYNAVSLRNQTLTIFNTLNVELRCFKLLGPVGLLVQDRWQVTVSKLISLQNQLFFPFCFKSTSKLMTDAEQQLCYVEFPKYGLGNALF